MANIQFIPKTWNLSPQVRNFLNELKQSVNKIKGDPDGDGKGTPIPAKVYPVSDGNGGFIAGDIKTSNYTGAPNRGSENVMMGYGAGESLVPAQYEGIFNVLLGTHAGGNMKDAANNTVVGHSAAYRLMGSANVAIGRDALSSNGLRDSNYNVMVGANSGTGLGEADFNTFLGCSTGHTLYGQKLDVTLSIAVGYLATTTKNRQAVIGTYNPGDTPLETITRGAHINTRTAVAKTDAASLTAAELLGGGLLTTNKATEVVLTLPTATDLLAVLNNGGGIGTSFRFYVQTLGAGKSTVAVNTGITTVTPVITGGANLEVTAANVVGCFEIYCVATATPTFKLARIF